ncbi:MAG: N-acetylmuramoyl-L-alanine amidase [Saprospiraceae bacterium]|nr:N-acetylmuramoyl-L-alanine amidase [Saprospiraceae bacterium]
MPLVVHNKLLTKRNYYSEEYPKTMIFLHHTAGAHNPISTIWGWEGDTRGRVATAFVIGNKSSDGLNQLFDGKVYRSFDETRWAYHLGIPDSGGRLDKISIGIEICAFGYLRKAGGKFYTYVNTEFTDTTAIKKLDKPFRGFDYYHAYSDAQVESLRLLLIDLGARFNINLKKGLQEWIKKETLKMPPGLNTTRKKQQWLRDNGFVGLDGKLIVADGISGENTKHALSTVGQSAFEYNTACFNGAPGIWTHTNVRTDKSDCFPHDKLKKMLLTL